MQVHGRMHVHGGWPRDYSRWSRLGPPPGGATSRAHPTRAGHPLSMIAEPPPVAVGGIASTRPQEKTRAGPLVFSGRPPWPPAPVRRAPDRGPARVRAIRGHRRAETAGTLPRATRHHRTRPGHRAGPWTSGPATAASSAPGADRAAVTTPGGSGGPAPDRPRCPARALPSPPPSAMSRRPGRPTWTADLDGRPGRPTWTVTGLRLTGPRSAGRPAAVRSRSCGTSRGRRGPSSRR